MGKKKLAVVRRRVSGMARSAKTHSVVGGGVVGAVVAFAGPKLPAVVTSAAGLAAASVGCALVAKGRYAPSALGMSAGFAALAVNRFMTTGSVVGADEDGAEFVDEDGATGDVVGLDIVGDDEGSDDEEIAS